MPVRPINGAAAVLLLLCLSSPALAQRPEFVKQGLLVPRLAVAPGVDPRAGFRAGEEARNAARKRLNGREVEVIQASLITSTMQRAGFEVADTWIEPNVRALGVHTRADEYVMGTVESDGRGGTPARIAATLVLMRDQRMRQPLLPATAPRLDDAAEQLGHEIAAARGQLTHLRRCENFLRQGNAAAAMRSARDGITAYPRSTMARTCLIFAQRAAGAAPAEVLATAREVLAVDSMNYHALESGALALDSLRRSPEAAPLWTRLAATDTADFVLTERVLNALHDGGSLRAAEDLAVRVASNHPEHLPFTRHKWRVAFDRQSWQHAMAAGEVLLQHDSMAVSDPVFFRRLSTVYRSAGKPFKSIEIAARGMSRFPEDSRLYSLYTQYILAEADTVLPRGLALFPQNGELLALHAQRLRAGGNLAAAVAAMRQAMSVDSTIPDAALMLAQAELDLGRPDSAIASMRRALRAGTDSTRIAQFAFARGNALYRAAQAARRAADYGMALQFLSLADSVRQTSQTRLLVGMAALGVAQASFAEAFADTDTARRCTTVLSATALLPLARTALEGGRDVANEAVDQGLGYVDQLVPYSETAVKAFCPEGTPIPLVAPAVTLPTAPVTPPVTTSPPPVEPSPSRPPQS